MVCRFLRTLAFAVAVSAGSSGVSVWANDPNCACPPAYCPPTCAAPETCAAPASCDCECRSGCRPCVVKVIKVRAPRFCCVPEAPRAVITQSVPAVLTNQAVVPVTFQAGQITPQPQSGNTNTETEELRRQVKQLRQDVDELAESTNRITKVLEKLDSKLDSIDKRLTDNGI